MIEGKQVYKVVEAVVPLYVAMLVGYGSVRWWAIFTPVQCSGINRFVAMFAVPVLSFNLIATSNMYRINYTFIAADTLQKLFVLLFLTASTKLLTTTSSSLEWVITLFSLTTLPNTLIVGIPLITAMYGEPHAILMIHIIVFQSILWYNLLLILFEYRAANILLSQQFPDHAHRIASLKVDSDVISLSGLHPLDTEADSDPDGRLHVRVMKRGGSYSSYMSSSSFRRPTLSDMSGVEIYSVQSTSASPSRNYDNNMGPHDQPHHDIGSRSSSFVYDVYGVSSLPRNSSIRRVLSTEIITFPPSDAITAQSSVDPENNNGGSERINNITSKGGGDEEEDSNNKSSSSIRRPTAAAASVVTKLILILVWRKLSRNPNTYASILGVVWSLVANRWGLKIPKIVQGCISIIANTGLGMAVFSLGLFMGLQAKMISCGKRAAGISMGMKFVVGPAVMAVTSLAVGIHGTLLRVAIVQAALPVGIVPFVFAKEYDVHADILSTSVIFGMLIALPVAILYNVLLAL